MSRRKIQCAKHGVSIWRNTIICIDCGQVWRLEDESEQCACGTKLADSAMAICEECYLKHLERLAEEWAKQQNATLQ
jgi:hypothetical protein